MGFFLEGKPKLKQNYTVTESDIRGYFRLGTPLSHSQIKLPYCVKILVHLKTINFPFVTNGKLIVPRCPNT